jgi:hypothetical protein
MNGCEYRQYRHGTETPIIAYSKSRFPPMKQLIECVPNISEGRDIAKINAIANVVTTVEGIKLLNVDPTQERPPTAR